MKYDISERYNCVVITFKGNLMGGPDAEEFREELHELIEKDKKEIIVDLGEGEVYKLIRSGDFDWRTDNYEKCRRGIGNLSGR